MHKYFQLVCPSAKQIKDKMPENEKSRKETFHKHFVEYALNVLILTSYVCRLFSRHAIILFLQEL